MFGTLLTFLASHFDLVELIYDAIVHKGLSKENAMKAIKDAMVATADAEMQKELPQ